MFTYKLENGYYALDCKKEKQLVYIICPIYSTELYMYYIQDIELMFIIVFKERIGSVLKSELDIRKKIYYIEKII